MKKTVVIILILFAFNQSRACDICGCKLGGLYFGILPQYTTHFLGLRYTHAAFTASMQYGSDYLEDEYSEDSYHRTELIGRYALSDRWYVSLVLPYLMNDMNGTHQKVRSAGIGDPSILMHYNVFNSGDDVSGDWKHSLMVGAGVKLPLGENEKMDQDELINRNFQLGSGSLDYLLSGSYTLRYKKAGVNVESSYKMNTPNRQDYRFGNQLNVDGYLFYWLTTNQVAFLPYAGVYYERASRHKDGEIIQHNTGGSALFGVLGLQLYRNNLSLNMLYQHPFSQDYNTDRVGTIEAGNRMSVGVTFNFSKKEKSML